jgi:hypothetical protein
LLIGGGAAVVTISSVVWRKEDFPDPRGCTLGVQGI